MKKILFAAALAAGTCLTSCNNKGEAEGTQGELDSLAYELGMMQSAPKAQLAEYLQQAGADSAFVDELIKGISDGMKAGENKKKMAYYMGVQIGMQSGMQLAGLESQISSDSTTHLNRAKYLEGFLATVKGKPYIVGGQSLMVPQVQAIAQARMQRLTAAAQEAKYGELKQKNAQFLAEVAKRPGVQKLGDLYYKVITEGKGEKPTAESTVEVEYEGQLIDGTVFDKSQEPVKFGVGQVIKGWTQALQAMPVGSEWELYIPYDLAYGEQGAGGQIPPYATLVFKVKLLNIVK